MDKSQLINYQIDNYPMRAQSVCGKLPRFTVVSGDDAKKVKKVADEIVILIGDRNRKGKELK